MAHRSTRFRTSKKVKNPMAKMPMQNNGIPVMTDSIYEHVSTSSSRRMVWGMRTAASSLNVKLS